MPETKFSTKEKNRILKEVLKKTNLYYEEILRKQEADKGEDDIESVIKSA